MVELKLYCGFCGHEDTYEKNKWIGNGRNTNVSSTIKCVGCGQNINQKNIVKEEIKWERANSISD